MSELDVEYETKNAEIGATCTPSPTSLHPDTAHLDTSNSSNTDPVIFFRYNIKIDSAYWLLVFSVIIIIWILHETDATRFFKAIALNPIYSQYNI